MAEFTFIVEDKDNQDTNTTDTFLFTDCTTNIQTTFTNTITQHPTERRRNITDHIFVHNNKFNITGRVTNNPITSYENNVIALQGNRVQIAYNMLKMLRDEGMIFSVVTGLEVYTDCVVKQLSIPRTAQNSSVLDFSIEIEQLQIATTSTVRLVEVVTPTKAIEASDSVSDGQNTTGKTGASFAALLLEYGVEDALAIFSGVDTEAEIIRRRAQDNVNTGTGN